MEDLRDIAIIRLNKLHHSGIKKAVSKSSIEDTRNKFILPIMFRL